MNKDFNKKDQVDFDTNELFLEYNKTKDINLRNQILMKYSYIANVIAVQMRGTTSNFAQVEDMVNQGIITLIDCIERFELDKGVKFETYAFLRLRGSMIDFVRKQDWVPRRIRKISREIKEATDKLSNELMRDPTDEEIANELKISVESLNKNYREIATGSTISFENLLEDHGVNKSIFYDETISPENSFIKKELKQKIMDSIDSLNEKERTIVSLYYYDNLKLREIADVLNVSESRVCQIHSKIISKLKNSLKRYIKE